jgi:hypothetical protein
MNNELERIWKEAAVAQTMYYTRFFVEGLKKTPRNSVKIDDPIRDLNQAPSKYE